MRSLYIQILLYHSINSLLLHRTCFVLHNMCMRAGDNGDWLVAAEPAQAAGLPAGQADAPVPEPGEADQRRRGQARRNGLAERLP